jgi:hypothetical protein
MKNVALVVAAINVMGLWSPAFAQFMVCGRKLPDEPLGRITPMLTRA